ncbi:MAG: FHA domain-containing protein, partial [Clostridiales bacterium]
FFIGLMLLSGIMWEYIFKSTNDNNIKFDPEGYLVSSLSEKIIDKKEFIIGRMEEHTDLTIENKAVGKKHAKIEKNNKKFYLFDLDSKNGTFINGNKLEKYKIYEILNNDKITFACCEYQFKIEDKRL